MTSVSRQLLPPHWAGFGFPIGDPSNSFRNVHDELTVGPVVQASWLEKRWKTFDLLDRAHLPASNARFVLRQRYVRRCVAASPPGAYDSLTFFGFAVRPLPTGARRAMAGQPKGRLRARGID